MAVRFFQGWSYLSISPNADEPERHTESLNLYSFWFTWVLVYAISLDERYRYFPRFFSVKLSVNLILCSFMWMICYDKFILVSPHSGFLVITQVAIDHSLLSLMQSSASHSDVLVPIPLFFWNRQLSQKIYTKLCGKLLHLKQFLKTQKINSPITLTNVALSSFMLIKKEIASDPSLAHTVLDTPLPLIVDASDSAVGAVLHHSVNDLTQPLELFSRQLILAEDRYSALLSSLPFSTSARGMWICYLHCS